MGSASGGGQVIIRPLTGSVKVQVGTGVGVAVGAGVLVMGDAVCPFQVLRLLETFSQQEVAAAVKDAIRLGSHQLRRGEAPGALPAGWPRHRQRRTPCMTPAAIVWGPELCYRRPDVTMEIVEEYLHNLYRLQPDFMYCVSRDFARSCQTPMLVMPDDTPSHSYEAAMELVELAPKAEVTAYPWKESEDVKAKTINQVRDFLLAHQPAHTGSV